MTITQFPLERGLESQETASLEKHVGSCVCVCVCEVGRGQLPHSLLQGELSSDRTKWERLGGRNCGQVPEKGTWYTCWSLKAP